MSAIHTAAATGFDADADRYARGRPDYPAEVGAWLRDRLQLNPGSVAIDLGAGTGKFTRRLVATGARVTAIEPAAAMRARLLADLPGIDVLDGSATAIPLPDQSADIIVCAQAFHWFATAAALAEMHRVLRPGGTLGLIWNTRDDSAPWVKRLFSIIEPYEGDVPRFHSGAWRGVFPATGFGPLIEARFRHEHVGPAEAVIVDRLLSVSFIASLPAPERERVAAALRAFAAGDPDLARQQDVAIPYVTHAYSTKTPLRQVHFVLSSALADEVGVPHILALSHWRIRSPMSLLFSPLALRDLTLRNRTVVAPMCQYSAQHGLANDWHLVHLGRFAMGGFGLVIVEATGVLPEGRISYGDLGLWHDEQIAPLARIVDFLHAQGTAAGIQLAHAGRKASTPIAWRRGFDETAEDKQAYAFESWTPVAPSPLIHSEKHPGFTQPREMTPADIAATVRAFADAARRADQAGFDVVEIHAAHGYLINQFLSPLANKRTDAYGGSRENRMRFGLEVIDAVRAAWPAGKPLFVRISATDGVEGGWTIEDSEAFAREVQTRGVDVVHVSSGGFEGYAIKPGPLYQVSLSKAVRDTGIKTVAVGLINDAHDAERILAAGDADLVALARGALEDPNWAVHAHHLIDGAQYDLWPRQARERVQSKDRALGLRQPN